MSILKRWGVYKVKTKKKWDHLQDRNSTFQFSVLPFHPVLQTNIYARHVNKNVS